jgi:hypothetical protein
VGGRGGRGGLVRVGIDVGDDAVRVGRGRGVGEAAPAWGGESAGEAEKGRGGAECEGGFAVAQGAINGRRRGGGHAALAESVDDETDDIDRAGLDHGRSTAGARGGEAFEVVQAGVDVGAVDPGRKDADGDIGAFGAFGDVGVGEVRGEVEVEDSVLLLGWQVVNGRAGGVVAWRRGHVVLLYPWSAGAPACAQMTSVRREEGGDLRLE